MFGGGRGELAHVEAHGLMCGLYGEQKIRPPKTLSTAHIMANGPNAGGEVFPAGWGAWNPGGVPEDNLLSSGITVDQWPVDIEKGFPNPAWDRSVQCILPVGHAQCVSVQRVACTHARVRSV